jgi:hypothetical protein
MRHVAIKAAVIDGGMWRFRLGAHLSDVRALQVQNLSMDNRKIVTGFAIDYVKNFTPGNRPAQLATDGKPHSQRANTRRI